MEDSGNNNVDNTMLDFDLGLPVGFEDDFGDIWKLNPMDSELDSDELSYPLNDNFAPNVMTNKPVVNVYIAEENQELDAVATTQNSYEEANTQVQVVSLADFLVSDEMILTAYVDGMGNGRGQPVHASNQIVQPPAVGTTSSRRKDAIRARNIHEELPAAPQPEPATGVFGHHDANAVEEVTVVKNPLKRLTKRPRPLKPKLHERDPTLFPEAKGAVYSKQNRDKKKEELAKAKEAAILAERKAQFFQERANVRDVVLRCSGQADAVMDLQKEDARLYKERFPEN